MEDVATPSISAQPPTDAEHPTSRAQQLTLKRRASASFADVLDDSLSRKRMKEEHDTKGVPEQPEETTSVSSSDAALADQLAQELQCGCCSELVYRPVIVAPCQHFFCGSCCVLWIRNGGTNCPHCRGLSTSVTPFRPLQSVLDVLLRAAPHKARTERERQQADEIYTGTSMRLPTPREASPEPDINPSDFIRPCPNCVLGNPYGWRCPQPIVDPNVDPENAWPLEDGTPPGHGLCGNCENLLALPSPLTTKCDFCQVSFCGIGVQGRCIASPISSQHPHAISDVGDLIQSQAVYECFNSNTVEAEIMFDYLTAQRITPRHIYREIVTHIQAQPGAFLPLIQQELFLDVHAVPAGADPEPDSPRSRICRQCAAEVFLYGLRDWFLRERQKGFLEESVLSRKDCEDGSDCSRQRDLTHAREFNHMIPNSAPAQSIPQEEAAVAQEVAVASTPPSPSDIPAPPSSGTNTPEESGTEVPVAFNDGPPADVPVVHDASNVPDDDSMH
ncbi:hypothetical protein C8F04DRAFT_1128839 [Mycena alexandri]|uniref:RING-type domain-containing protein n=1 Tax=Mycena alexandri TaxID=1745969 RepID=A0AAD6SCW0_9AGAR|nr:hypothetical protein C8F04DRAFT_1128839 [Mycena alexandri]